jgi:hypothetical protein
MPKPAGDEICLAAAAVVKLATGVTAETVPADETMVLVAGVRVMAGEATGPVV